MAFGTNKSSPLDDTAAAGLIPQQFVPISGATPPPPWGMLGTPIFDLLTYLYGRRGADFQEEQASFLSMKETLRQVDRPIGEQGFLGMEKATRLLHDALVNKIHIAIVGDFDVDGVCATAILMRALRPFTMVTAVIPDRKTEGYGLSPALIPRIPESAGLVITVDNGISAMAGARMVRQRGQKLLITDHHLPGDQVPDADAIINPNQHGCPFPWKSTCGAGVAWYLLWALQTIYPEWKTRMPIRALLSLVALATVADVVPLERNNRLLVRLGLDIIRRGDAPIGLYALFRVSGRNAAQASSTDCGFSLGPRLNAAGRMANMSQGLDLLLSDTTQAQTMAEALQKINQERRAVEGTAMEEAVEQAMRTLPDNLTCRGHHTCSTDPQKNILVLADPRWHEGVVGLMAGRLKERFGSPVFVFAPAQDGGWKGSGRSVEHFHLRDALAWVAAQHPELLTRFGGHAMAAGLSIQHEHLDAFRDAIQRCPDWTRYVERRPEVNAVTDGALPASLLRAGPSAALRTAVAIRAAGPWGAAFPEPVFCGAFQVKSSDVMKGGHWRLRLTPIMNGTQDGESSNSAVTPVALTAVRFFRQAGEVDSDPPPEEGTLLTIEYTLQVNTWKGEDTAQIIVQNVRSTSAAD